MWVFSCFCSLFLCGSMSVANQLSQPPVDVGLYGAHHCWNVGLFLAHHGDKLLLRDFSYQQECIRWWYQFIFLHSTPGSKYMATTPEISRLVLVHPWTIPIFKHCTPSKGPFSISILVYRSVGRPGRRIGDRCGRAVSLKLAIWGMAICTVLQGCLIPNSPG